MQLVHHILHFHQKLELPGVIHSHHQLVVHLEYHKYLVLVLEVNHIETRYLVCLGLFELMLLAHPGYRDNHQAPEL